MNIQASINQGLSIASMLYTQTDKYQGQQEFKREKREAEVEQRKKKIGKVIGADDPEVEAASREYELTGNHRAYIKALRRQSDIHFENGGFLGDYGIDVVGSGGNREIITQIQDVTGYSRGKSAALLRAAQRRERLQDIYASPEYAAAQQRVRERQGGPK